MDTFPVGSSCMKNYGSIISYYKFIASTSALSFLMCQGHDFFFPGREEENYLQNGEKRAVFS